MIIYENNKILLVSTLENNTDIIFDRKTNYLIKQTRIIGFL